MLSPAVAAETAVPIGTRVADFTLSDYRGEQHSLSDYGEAKVVVLAVLGTECPLAKLYAPRLQSVADRYAGKGVVVLGVNANAQDSITEIAADVQRHGLKFPVLKDLHQQVADSVGASRTPEIVVLDADRVIRYRGRIDDRYGIGYAKDVASEDYLVDAIEAILAGRPIETASVEPVGCLIGRTKTPTADASVTYTGDVAAILNRRCVECHREGEIAPFTLTDYESASGWAEMIAEVVREGRMPPWHAADPVSGSTSHDGTELSYVEHVRFANRRRLSDDEQRILLAWSAAGAPKGDGAAPEFPVDSVAGWQLPSAPDAVFAMAEEPFQVPAEGAVEYQYFKIATNFTEDKWVKAAEIIPGNRAVVHHVLVYAAKQGRTDALGVGRGEFLAAYVPGLKPASYPPGMAKLIPAGAEMLFQVHYTPVGSAQSDLSKIGLVFASPDEVDHLVETRSVIEQKLTIVPQEADQKIAADETIPYDEAKLLSLMPHMHLRGQAFRYTLDRDGDRKTLLDVPHYDFNWQTGYRLDEPIELVQGDRILGEAWYDNSPANLANPDPSATVHWGNQTWNEMMIGYYDVAVPLDDEARKDVREGRFTIDEPRPATDEVDQRVRETFERHDADDDGKLTLDEVPERLRRIHKQVDRDGDGNVNAGELKRAFQRAAD